MESDMDIGPTAHLMYCRTIETAEVPDRADTAWDEMNGRNRPRSPNLPQELVAIVASYADTPGFMVDEVQDRRRGLAEICDFLGADNSAQMALDTVVHTVKTLTEAQDPSVRDEPPLITCCTYNLDNLAAALIAQGLGLNERSRAGSTPLLAAIDGRKEGLVVDMLRGGANSDLPGRSGITPLIRAIEQRESALVRALLESKADPNLSTDIGGTPLTSAIYVRDHGLVMTLLNANADPNVTDQSGHKALAHAYEMYDASIIETLVAVTRHPEYEVVGS